MKLELNRTYGPKGTNGEIFLQGKKVCSTIELPWKQNEARISCIPEGTYELKKRYSVKFGRHLHVTGVNGRQLILLHAANDAQKELKGCIAPVSFLTGEGKGTGSRVALAKLMTSCDEELQKGQPVFLTIQSNQT
jgi:hypothetical protein